MTLMLKNFGYSRPIYFHDQLNTDYFSLEIYSVEYSYCSQIRQEAVFKRSLQSTGSVT